MLAAPTCGDDGDTDSDASLTWYTTCGDPVYSTYSSPFEGVPICRSETDGS